jgi:hypothetical protein
MTISPTIKAKVIELHLQKKGRNEIAREINISQDSVHNILRTYESKSKSTATGDNGHNQNHSQVSAGTPVEDIPMKSLSQGPIINAYEQKREQSSQPDATINSGVDIEDMCCPSTMAPFGDELAVTTHNSNSSPDTITPRNGGPLLHLLNHESIDRARNENADIDFATITYAIPFSPYRRPPESPKARQISSISYKSGPLNSSESTFVSSEEQVDIEPDVKNVLEEESELMGVLSPEEIENSKPKGRDTSESIEKAEAETLFTETNKLVKGPSTPVEERLRQEKVAWDYYGPAWMGILKQIRREKDQRRHELLVIDRRKQKLSEWKKRLEQMQYDLTTREVRILESEPFLPLARQLQEMKLALEDALPWIETVKELAQMQNMDIKAAVVQVAQELRLYRQSWGIQKQIERANQELALINMESIQNQQALAVLRDLLNRGVTESQIVQLINFAGEWNKYWQSSKTNGNLQQPVNGSNNPGSSGGNGYGGNFSINDLIRLNLLKSTTTNLLKSARRPPGL